MQVTGLILFRIKANSSNRMLILDQTRKCILILLHSIPTPVILQVLKFGFKIAFSGHESSVSTPESPSTPEEECSVITAEQSSKKASDDKAATVASTITDTKIYKIR